MGQSTEQWLGRLDALGSYAPLAAIRRCLDGAPGEAKQTPDYWYARGVVDARFEIKAGAASRIRGEMR